MTDLSVDFAEAFRRAAVEALTDPEVLATVAAAYQRPIVCTKAETAELLRCSVSQVERWVTAGVLPRMPHTGRKVLIPRVAIEAFVTVKLEPQRSAS